MVDKAVLNALKGLEQQVHMLKESLLGETAEEEAEPMEEPEPAPSAPRRRGRHKAMPRFKAKPGDDEEGS